MLWGSSVLREASEVAQGLALEAQIPGDPKTPNGKHWPPPARVCQISRYLLSVASVLLILEHSWCSSGGAHRVWSPEHLSLPSGRPAWREVWLVCASFPVPGVALSPGQVLGSLRTSWILVACTQATCPGWEALLSRSLMLRG